MFTKALALLLFPVLAVAQSAPSASSSASSTSSALGGAPSAPANTPGQINVDVFYQNNLVFNPKNINAHVGDLVTFYFPNLNQSLALSVTQSTFAAPCTYLAANTSTNSSAGFDSGLTSGSTFTINITSQNPIYYFCKQSKYCGLGMVGSINAPATGNTSPAYLAAAKAIGNNEVTTPDNGPVIAGVGASATGPPVSDVTSSPRSPSPTPFSSAMKVPTSNGFALFAAVLAVSMA